MALTGRSRRTWWRRIEAGAVTKLPPDARGRTMLAFGEVRAAIALVLDDQEADAIVRADAGQASAQAQVGAMFALAALTALTAVSGDEPQSVARGGGGGGGGGIAPLPSIGCNWPPPRTTPTPCTGWACFMPRAMAVVTIMSTWR